MEVDEALAGLTLMNPGVVLLGERAVARRDHARLAGRVALVSGGASGREPFPAGYVGPGMLTAAVVGAVSVAPPPLAVVRLVRRLLAAGGSLGALLVACDRRGDRLSLAVAAERLEREGCSVRLLVAPGEAGAVLLFKVAGALAERGVSLPELLSACSRVLAGLSTVHVDPRTHLQDTEPCVEEAVCQMDHVVAAVERQFPNMPPPAHVALLVNNTGEMSKLNEQVFASRTVQQFVSRGYEVQRLYCGNFATCQGRKLFSVTALHMLPGGLAGLLDAATSAPGWPRTPCPACRQEEACPQEAGVAGAGVTGLLPGDDRVLAVVECAAQAIAACEEQINALDGGRGDGDCGTTLRAGAQAIARALHARRLDCSSPSSLLFCLAALCGEDMGGVCGAACCALFTAAAQEAGTSAGSAWGPSTWAAALRAGVGAVARLCGDPAGSGATMLDALEAAVSALDRHVGGHGPGDPVAAASAAARAAELAAGRTGRPPHMGEDPGAHAVAVCLRGVCEGVKRLGGHAS